MSHIEKLHDKKKRKTKHVLLLLKQKKTSVNKQPQITNKKTNGRTS